MGFLREASAYKAKARYYADGPLSDIEFYAAAPGAAYFSGTNAFFPMNDYLGEEHTGVGELTGQGSRQFNLPPVLNPPPGTFVNGTEDDFAGSTLYMGPPTPDQIPDCTDPDWEAAADVPEGPPDRLRFRMEEMVVQTDDGERTLALDVIGTYDSSVQHYYNFPGGFDNANAGLKYDDDLNAVGWSLYMEVIDPGLTFRFRFTWHLNWSPQWTLDSTANPDFVEYGVFGYDFVPEALLTMGRMRVDPIWD